jgi:hypothetical protein
MNRYYGWRLIVAIVVFLSACTAEQKKLATSDSTRVGMQALRMAEPRSTADSLRHELRRAGPESGQRRRRSN